MFNSEKKLAKNSYLKFYLQRYRRVGECKSNFFWVDLVEFNLIFKI